MCLLVERCVECRIKRDFDLDFESVDFGCARSLRVFGKYSHHLTLHLGTKYDIFLKVICNVDKVNNLHVYQSFY